MKILFVVAHPDDEVYGPYGTIARMVQEGNEVMVLCLCTGKRPNANQEVSKNRIKTFISNCQNLNVKYELWDNDDLDLTLNETAHKLTKFIDLNKPEIVYTHNISDINHDHQIAAEATMIACRPKPECSVNELYFFVRFQPKRVCRHVVYVARKYLYIRTTGRYNRNTRVHIHPIYEPNQAKSFIQ